jgi:hypothetical protein
MIGRHRPHFARDLDDMVHRPLGLVRAAGLEQQRTDPVAINAEILVAALGDHDFIASVEQQV